MINNFGERELVSIQTIDEVVKHPNADALDLVTIGGWQMVAKLGEFQPGDECLYFEIDSVLPELPPFEFLRKSCFVDREWIRGFRLKTIRLRGEFSQGLVVPLGALQDLGVSLELARSCESLTALLGVQKWDPPAPASLGGLAKGSFPSWIPKTDQERIQNLRKALDTWSDTEINLGLTWEVTEKLDGSSMTCFVRLPTHDGMPDPGEAADAWSAAVREGVCSRNLELTETEGNAFWQVARRERILQDLRALCVATRRSLALQGELVGPGVQGNPFSFGHLRFFVFDVYDIEARRYLEPAERRKIVADLGLDHVPVVSERFSLCGDGTSPRMGMAEILAMANGASEFSAVPREGLVFKQNPMDEPGTSGIRSNQIQHTSFKTISNVWLLKKGE
jgi:RNA ligase (TIGR02306 family)